LAFVPFLVVSQNQDWTGRDNLFGQISLGNPANDITIDHSFEGSEDYEDDIHIDNTIKDLLAQFNDHVLENHSTAELEANRADNWSVKTAFLKKIADTPCPPANEVFCNSFKTALSEHVSTLTDVEISQIYPVDYREITYERKEEIGIISPAVRSLAMATERTQCDDPNYHGRRKKRSVEGCSSALPLISLQYGCWCDGNNDNIYAGRGAPVDEFDKICKAHRNCQRCVKLDATEDQEICDPMTVPYSVMSSLSLDQSQLVAQCYNDNENNSNCAIHSCCCNLEMTRALMQLMMNGIPINPQFKHSNGFDPNDPTFCPVQNHGEVERQCCGVYPSRRIFNQRTRNCCHDNKIYDPLNRVCCDDGSIAPSHQACGELKKKRKK